MSCNYDEAGCGGGSPTNAHQAWTHHGISRERSQPYKCGGGKHEHHWENSSPCPRSPWGAVCAADKVAGWFYGSAFHILGGENNMMTLLSQGNSFTVLYVTEGKFLTWGKERPVSSMGSYWTTKERFRARAEAQSVYTARPSSDTINHGMTAIGYGVQRKKKYWLIQNSWGTDWGDSGMVKIQRGVNLGMIETYVHYFRGWVEGAKEPLLPTCIDDNSCKAFERRECQSKSLETKCPVLCNSYHFLCNEDLYTGDPPPPTPPPTQLSCSCSGHLNQFICADGTESYCSEWQHCVMGKTVTKKENWAAVRYGLCRDVPGRRRRRR